MYHEKRRDRPRRSSSASRKLTSHCAACATRTAPSSRASTRSATAAKGGACSRAAKSRPCTSVWKATPAPGFTSVSSESLADRAAFTDDADLDDAVGLHVESGHLEVDEGERRFGHGEVPRRPARRRRCRFRVRLRRLGGRARRRRRRWRTLHRGLSITAGPCHQARHKVPRPQGAVQHAKVSLWARRAWVQVR